MKSLVSIPALFILILGSTLFAQTTIPKNAKVSGSWTQDQSPYIIEGEAIVPQGQVLSIEPGTVIQFKTGENADYSQSSFDKGMLRVQGVLEALGTSDQMIQFTRKGDVGTWGVIFLQNETEPSELAYCKISHSKWIRNIVPDDNGTAAVTFFRSKGTVRNSVLSNNWAGINAKQSASPTCYHNVLVRNKYGIESNSNSTPEIYNTIIWNNDAAFYLIDGGVARLSYSFVSESDLPEDVVDQGKNILGKNPKFMNPLRENYHLAPGSPCIRKGLGNVDMGAFPDEHTSRLVNKKDEDKKKKKKRRSEDDLASRLNARVGPSSADLANIPEAQYHALLIGVKRYEDRNIQRKPRSIQYMRKLRSILSHNYGFEDANIRVLENPSRQNIIDEILNLQDILGQNDHLLICYSGQFEWDRSTRNGFWLPSDADIQHTNTWLSHERLQSMLAFLPNRHTLVLTETPFGGIQGLTRSDESDAENSLKELQVLKSRQVIAGDPAQDRADKAQPWMDTLLATLLANRSMYLSGEGLLTRLTVASREAPVHGGVIKQTGDQGGEFVLKRTSN